MADPPAPPPEPPFYGQADFRPGSDYPVQADIPARPVTRTRRNSGLIAGALAILGLLIGKLQYALIVLLKFKGFVATFISVFFTVVIYAQFFGWVFAAGVVLLILVHELGHLVVARALGIPATLPILIPFLGAFVRMQQTPKTVAQEAQMAIGGPILGSIGAGLCYAGYLLTPGSRSGALLMGLAYFGFLINLFNLVPVTPLDGGRVLSVLSKWFNVAGLVVAAGLLVLTDFRSPILLLVLVFGAMSTLQRFRSTVENPAYYEVPASTKWTIGLVYLALLAGLALGFESASSVVRGVF